MRAGWCGGLRASTLSWRGCCPADACAHHHTTHHTPRWPKTIFLKALGPFLACVIGIVVIVAGKWTDGKGPIKVRVDVGWGCCVRVAVCWSPEGVSGWGCWLQRVAPSTCS